MTTLADLIADISDDIDDTTNEYSDQIEKAVKAAQRYCERFTFYFNETRDEVFPTVDGQEWYGATDNANIPTLVHINALYSEDSQGQRTTLVRVPPSEIETLSDNSAARGEPYLWTYFDQKIRLYPIPSSSGVVAPSVFSLTAGTSGGSGTGYVAGSYGSIESEPLPGFPLLTLVTTGSFAQVAFAGDCVSTISRWQPVIPGVTLDGLVLDWSFDGDKTLAIWNATSAMADNETYGIRWKQVSALGGYTIRMQIGPYRLTPLESPGDSNAWLTEAYDLMKARAKYIFAKNTLKDANMAMEALNDYQDQLASLRAETSSRNGSGCIQPTTF